MTTLYFGGSSAKHAGHAYTSRFGGRSLCGRETATSQDQLTTKQPARLCRFCAKLIASTNPQTED